MIEDVPGTFVPEEVGPMAWMYTEPRPELSFLPLSGRKGTPLYTIPDLAERAAVVAYLRAYAKEMEEYHSVVPGFIRGAADAVERGEHRKDGV